MKPDELLSVGSERVGHDRAIEQQQSHVCLRATVFLFEAVWFNSFELLNKDTML